MVLLVLFSVMADLCFFLLICVLLTGQSSTSSKYCDAFSDITKIGQEASKQLITSTHTMHTSAIIDPTYDMIYYYQACAYRSLGQGTVARNNSVINMKRQQIVC